MCPNLGHVSELREVSDLIEGMCPNLEHATYRRAVHVLYWGYPGGIMFIHPSIHGSMLPTQGPILPYGVKSRLTLDVLLGRRGGGLLLPV